MSPGSGTEWRRGRQPSFDRLGGLRRPAERRMDDLAQWAVGQWQGRRIVGMGESLADERGLAQAGR